MATAGAVVTTRTASVSTGSDGDCHVTRTSALRRKATAGLALVLSTSGLLTMALASGGRVGPTESLFELVWGGTAQRYAFWYGLTATGVGLGLGRFVGNSGESDGGTGAQSR